MSNSDKAMLDSNLEGQLLIAMPGMSDPRFARSVILMCAHSSDTGAMGLIINQQEKGLTFGGLLSQIEAFDDADELQRTIHDADRPIHIGGPVEKSRGFALHSPDYFAQSASSRIIDGICLTVTAEILKAIARGSGPEKYLLALGYAGWAPGQLEGELGANGWLNCDADPELVFGADPEAKYEQALAKLGVNPSHLMSTAGRA